MYKWTASSHLSPGAIRPVRTRARFTSSVLIGLDSLHTVICGVSIFILTHNHTPLRPASTGTGTLNTSDISQQVNLHHDIPTLGSQKQLTERLETNVTEIVHDGQKAIMRTSLPWGPLMYTFKINTWRAGEGRRGFSFACFRPSVGVQ